MRLSARVALALVQLLLRSLGWYSVLFLSSPLKTRPWQSHEKGFSSPGKHVPGERSRRQFPQAGSTPGCSD